MVIGDGGRRRSPPASRRRTRLAHSSSVCVNGPIQWGDTMWAALTWDTIANWPARTRGEAFVHESFHIVQPKLGDCRELAASE